MVEFSIEAQVVAGAFWGALTEVSFKRPHIIHERARKGLDELVAAGLLTMRPRNDRSAELVWTATPRMKKEGPKPTMAFLKANAFPITTD